MNNKVRKIIYKLRTEKNGLRKIKSILMQKYNIDCTEGEIKNIIRNIPYKKDKYNSIDKNKILYMYCNIVNSEKLIVYLNKKYNYELTINRIKDLACRNGVKKKTQNMYKQSFISRKDEYNIISLYTSGMTANQISKIYGYKTRNSILQKLDKFSVKRRVWNDIQSKNKSYSKFNFNFIDSEQKAYFLGLLLTDGYINIERGYVGIDLSDKDVIEYLSKIINVSYSTIEDENVKNKYRIILYGRNIVSQLERLGVVEKKTFILKGPNLFEEELRYINYILRGIIDGDGWIRKDGNEFFISSASKDFINWCKDALEVLEFEDIKVNFIRNEYNGIYVIRTAKKYNIEMLKNKIYNKPFGMFRKYELLL